jgi:hypothetical protein
MYKTVIALLLAFVPQLAIGQAAQSPFAKLMEFAKEKRILQVDTVAGKTNVLITTVTDNPSYLIIFAPGGEGFISISANQDGAPISKRSRSSAFVLGYYFLEKQAAFAAIDTPADYGGDISIRDRQMQRHIEAIGQVGQRLRADYPRAKHILLGHSNGGITAGMQAISEKRAFDGIVMSAPAVGGLPWSWADRVNVPLMFITHEEDACKGTPAPLIIRAAGKKFPITVIKTPSAGISTECRGQPAPHFFSNTEGEYVDAILKWAASLK